MNKRERSEQLESLVRELAEALQLYENQEVWDDLVAVQVERNKVLHKAKEVLGDV